MKILLLTQYFPPEPGSGSSKMAELADFLAGRGHKVVVVTAFPNRPEGRIHQGYKMGLWLKEKRNGYTIVRVPLYITSKRRSFKHRMLNHISFMVTAIYGGLIAGKTDIVYFYSPPIFLGITAWFLKKRNSAKSIMEINDLWPDAAIYMGVIKSHAIRKIAWYFEKSVYGITDHLSFYSNIHRQTIINKGISKSKTEIHKLWVDTKLFCMQNNEDVELKKAISEIRSKYRFNDKFVLLYAGKIGFAQGLDVVVDAATKLKDDPTVMFAIMGEGPEEKPLKELAKKRRLTNLVFIQYKPIGQVPKYLRAADVLYAQLAPAPHRLGTIPAKVLSYMSMGRPVVVAAKGETETLLKESGAGIAIEPNDAQTLVDAILFLKGSSDTENMGKAGRFFALRHFDRNTLLHDLEKRLIEIADNQKGELFLENDQIT